MKNIYALLILFLSVNYVNAQAPAIEWEKAFGGSSGDINTRSKVIETSDGGFLFVTESSSLDGDVGSNNGNTDVWIVKTDNTGNIEWQKSFGGSSFDRAQSVVETKDSCFVVLVSSQSADFDFTTNFGLEDIWVLKIDNQGNLLWKKHFGGTNNDSGSEIIELNSGNLIFTATVESNDVDISGNHGLQDIWFVKISPNGDFISQKCLGGSSVDFAEDLIIGINNELYIGGTTYSNDGDVSGTPVQLDFWLVKCDTMGNILWEKNYGQQYEEWIFALSQSSNGDIFIAGRSGLDFITNYNYLVYKVEPTSGNIIWQKEINSTLNTFDSHDAIFSIIATSDGGCVITGQHRGDGQVSGVQSNTGIYKLNSFGSNQWFLGLEGPGNNFDAGISIIQTQDNGYLLLAFTESPVTNFHGGADAWLVKFSPDSTTITQTPENQVFSMFTLFPNPASGVLNIDYVPNQKIAEHTYTVFDLQGKQIQKGILQLGKNALNISQLPAGHYMIKTPVGTQPFEVVR